MIKGTNFDETHKEKGQETYLNQLQ